MTAIVDFFVWLPSFVADGLAAIWGLLAFAFSQWWGWTAWAMVLCAVAFAYRRVLISALANTYGPSIATTLSAARTAGSNARRLLSRKGRS